MQRESWGHAFLTTHLINKRMHYNGKFLPAPTLSVSSTLQPWATTTQTHDKWCKLNQRYLCVCGVIHMVTQFQLRNTCLLIWRIQINTVKIQIFTFFESDPVGCDVLHRCEKVSQSRCLNHYLLSTEAFPSNCINHLTSMGHVMPSAFPSV